MPRRQQPEQAIQRSLVQHLRCRGALGAVWWHTPNGAFLGGKRNRRGIAIQGGIMKSLGVRAGVADLCIVHESTPAPDQPSGKAVSELTASADHMVKTCADHLLGFAESVVAAAHLYDAMDAEGAHKLSTTMPR